MPTVLINATIAEFAAEGWKLENLGYTDGSTNVINLVFIKKEEAENG